MKEKVINLMKKLVYCTCGSGKPKDDCCPTNIRVRAHPFANRGEYTKMLDNLHISSLFKMRHRGLLDFYGDDLIEYQRQNQNDPARTQFLEVFSNYLTTYLEDACPSSWQECKPEFWEEFLTTYYPSLMKISPQEKEVEKFLSEFKKFTRWLDNRIGTTFYETVKTYTAKCSEELKQCEILLNRLFLHTFPKLHNPDSDPREDVSHLHQQFKGYDETTSSVFEVRNLNYSIIVATALDSHLTYNIKGLPFEHITPGTIISGTITKKKGDWIWTWFYPEGVFPPSSREYLEHVIL
jgi:hypothetical protein